MGIQIDKKRSVIMQILNTFDRAVENGAHIGEELLINEIMGEHMVGEITAKTYIRIAREMYKRKHHREAPIDERIRKSSQTKIMATKA